jgi:endonuclease YncB( thermonuclease family)
MSGPNKKAGRDRHSQMKRGCGQAQLRIATQKKKGWQPRDSPVSAANWLKRPMLHRFRLAIGLLSIIAVLCCTRPSYSTAPTTISCADCSLIPVDRVIDGDTFDSSYSRVHLYGVDAPERGDQCFSEATDRLRALAGDAVRVELGPRKRDSFGRVLAYVYTKTGNSVDETLVRDGLAWALTNDGQHYDSLVAAARGARQGGVGCLW